VKYSSACEVESTWSSNSRIRSLTLTPGINEQGPFYTVSGDVDLFAVPPDAVQTNQVDLIGLQYTIPVAFSIAPHNSRSVWAEPTAA
jgi:hypothetical protein